MTLIARNWRCRIGELDLVMWNGQEIVFVEVKSRYAVDGAARLLFDAITPRKARTLQLLTQVFLRALHLRVLPRHRIDVIGVLVERGSSRACRIEHLRGVL